ncbi:MAG: VOC family protein [Acidimicrobiales bacterium]|nr:VOC family protein [Acidimicrobiales bacterium]
MVDFASHEPGTPSWVDLMSPDVDASAQFYTSVFGWESEDQLDDDGNRVYVMFRKDGKAVAGLGGQPPGMGEMPAVWNTYITTADVAETTEKVTANGGSVMMPGMQVMTAGEMAIYTDPTGAAFSVWKPVDHIGAEVGNVENTYSWAELNTRDVDAALPFYAAVFGWEYQSGAAMPGYHLIAGGTNDEGLGGIMQMAPEVPEMVPNHWATYFSVADVAATVGRIEAAGGSIVMPAMPIPGVGTMVVAHDPAGGNFSVMQPETPPADF